MNQPATIFIPYAFPGLNEINRANRGNRYAGAGQKKKTQQAILNILRAKNFHPKFDKVKIHFKWVEKNKRRDPDNFSSGGRKVILDAFVKAGIIPDDSQKYLFGFADSWGVIDKTNPGVWVTIAPVTRSEEFFNGCEWHR